MGRGKGVVTMARPTSADSSVELAVVVISISRHRSSLASGNIVGSTISNILGAFSLGLQNFEPHWKPEVDLVAKVSIKPSTGPQMSTSDRKVQLNDPACYFEDQLI